MEVPSVLHNSYLTHIFTAWMGRIQSIMNLVVPYCKETVYSI